LFAFFLGLGSALAYAPSVVMVGHHFTKRRALANGISVSGSAVGSFVLPNLMRYLLNLYGLQVFNQLILSICVALTQTC
jgi:MFS family permease